MARSSSFSIVLVTVPSRRQAQAIAKAVLQAKLAACVNIIPHIESHFWWDNKIDSAGEYLLIMKTSRRHFRKLSATVHAIHSYQTPEIIAFPVSNVDKIYAKWWADSID